MGGKETEKSESVSDPWTTMPQWQKDYYQWENNVTQETVGEAGNIVDYLRENPAVLSDLTEGETQAVNDFLWQVNQSQGIGEDALDRAYGYGDEAMYGLDDAMARLPGYGEDLDATFERYENPYTDDVVDTTLAGMQRQADRDSALRGASAASAGGMNSTRASVGDAIAGQLTNMNMGEMEAKLRSDAFNTSRGLGLQQQGMEENQAFNRGNMALEGGRFGQDMSRNMSELADAQMMRQAKGSEAMSQYYAAQRGIDDANREAQRTSGRDAMSWFGDMFRGTRGTSAPVGGTTTTTQEKPNSMFGNILGAVGSIAGAAIMASDEDVKEGFDSIEGDVALQKLQILRPSTYTYKDGYGHVDGSTSGLIAQDIEDAEIVGAVIEKDGVKHVDMYPVLATVVSAVQALDQRQRAAGI